MEHDLFLIGTDEERIGKITKGAGFGRHPFCEDLVSGMVSDWFQARPGSPLQGRGGGDENQTTVNFIFQLRGRAPKTGA
jgi:hypothetical protein